MRAADQMLRSLLPSPRPPFSSLSTSSDQLLSLLLAHCSNLKHIYQTHGFMVSRGLDLNFFLLSRFIHACSSLGFSDYAFEVFTHAQNPHIYLYNTMIKALSESQTHASASASAREAIMLYSKIRAAGLRPDTYSVPFALKAVVRLSAIQIGKQIHSQTISTGLDLDVYVITAFIQMYSSCGSVRDDARKLFDGARSFRDVGLWNAMIVGYTKAGDLDNARHLFEQMPQRDVISWTAIIAGCAQRNRSNEAITVFRRMQLQGVVPDEVTLLAALSACAQLGAIEFGEWIHNYIDKHGLQKIVPLNNALIDMYAKSGNIEKAQQVFKHVEYKTVVTWTTMIAGLALHGLGREALDMFSRMERSKIKPNEITFIAILSACSHAGLVEIGRWYFNNMRSRHGIEPKIEHYGCMIDLLGRAGCFQEAHELVNGMPFDANEAIWGSLLAASNIHGDAELGERALQHLIKLEPHNSGNYTILSHIYAAHGRWNESGRMRKVMRDEGVKKMPGGSFVEVNNRVHQFVAGDRSHLKFDCIYDVLCTINKHFKMAGNLRKECIAQLELDP